MVLGRRQLHSKRLVGLKGWNKNPATSGIAPLLQG
jgi:hypothetical protein